MAEPAPKRMTVDEFLEWAVHRPGRYELHDGYVVGMSPERNMHARTKRDTMIEFMRAVAAAGVDCEVFPDGASVVVDDGNSYEPDVAVNCGARADNLSLTIDSPVIVVEVTSPTTGAIDTGSKLIGYMRTQAIRHILILDPVKRAVVHHRRTGPATFDSHSVVGGALRLDPPGIEVDVGAFFASV